MAVRRRELATALGTPAPAAATAAAGAAAGAGTVQEQQQTLQRYLSSMPHGRWMGALRELYAAMRARCCLAAMGYRLLLHGMQNSYVQLCHQHRDETTRHEQATANQRLRYTMAQAAGRPPDDDMAEPLSFEAWEAQTAAKQAELRTEHQAGLQRWEAQSRAALGAYADMLGACVQWVQFRCQKVLAIRLRRSPVIRELVDMYRLTVEFEGDLHRLCTVDSESILGGGVAAHSRRGQQVLVPSLLLHAKRFVETAHQRFTQSLTELLRSEAWVPADVAPEFQEVAARLQAMADGAFLPLEFVDVGAGGGEPVHFRTRDYVVYSNSVTGKLHAVTFAAPSGKQTQTGLRPEQLLPSQAVMDEVEYQQWIQAQEQQWIQAQESRGLTSVVHSTAPLDPVQGVCA
ncbi:Vps54; component of GARP (Golgi-associated retrograde protein) complex [Paratrimastix pyriformis]|uniref:Vps54 n=1 Tax=Paratrimastix pyriformis TaxID=342808 RepID=A0ABQ8UAI1_9EUKA|nr:Vps54; component of GARP (Golgi-associated retrograde protein) complex [Paratrimastix pyriformis]